MGNRRRGLGSRKDEEPGEENKSRSGQCIKMEVVALCCCPFKTISDLLEVDIVDVDLHVLLPLRVLFMPACHIWIQASKFKNISLGLIIGGWT